MKAISQPNKPNNIIVLINQEGHAWFSDANVLLFAQRKLYSYFGFKHTFIIFQQKIKHAVSDRNYGLTGLVY